MATLKAAKKVDIIRSLEFSEYNGTEWLVGADPTGAQVTVTLPDSPAHRERQEIRKAIDTMELLEYEKLDDLVRDILAMLDKRELDDSVKVNWNSEERKPRAFSSVLYLDVPQREALVNLLSGTEVSYDTRQTVNAALTGDSTTRW